MKQIHRQLNLIFSATAFFVMVNALNALNAADDVAFVWKLAGVVGVVLFIASLRVDDDATPRTANTPAKE